MGRDRGSRRGDEVDGCDVVVIGAGIIGASCAFQLADAGLDVVIVDRHEAPAMGSTGLSAAGVRVQFVEPTNVALSLASIREYATFEERYGVDGGYRAVGYLLLVPDAQWEAHLAGVEVQRSLGAPVEVLDLEAVGERFAAFDPAGLAGATFGPIDGVVDPNTVTHTYLALARERGARVRLRSEVTAISSVGDRWELIVGDHRLRAGTVVNAAGCWAGEVGGLAGVEVPVAPYRRMVYVTAPLAGRATTPLTVDLGTGLYFRSEGERLLFGRSNPDEAPGFATGMDAGWLEPTLTAAMERFPWFAEERLDTAASWYGYYEMTPDHNALIGASVDAPGWVDACGFSGHGVQQAPAVGRAVREEIVDGRATTIDIDPLRPERLRAGQLRSERHII